MISAKLQRTNIYFMGIERKKQNEGSIIDFPLSQPMGKKRYGSIKLNKLEISFHFNIIYTLVFTTSLRCT